MNTPMLAAGALALLGMNLFHGCPTRSTVHSPPVADRVEAQIARGAQVYTQHCAACHGKAGQGTSDAPAVVGPGALARYSAEGAARRAEFRTAMDVAQFVTQSMPPDESRRGQIAEQDYWAILAFALSANGVEVREPVSPHNAKAIVLHP
jgi:S-disulfanyl-L-cysteine oxidoreductase SoxD